MPIPPQRAQPKDLQCQNLEKDTKLAIGVRQSAPKTLDAAVREVVRLDCIHRTVHTPKVNAVPSDREITQTTDDIQSVLKGI